MMWSPRESRYRGQATDGTVITVDEDAMQAALKQAGNGIFETDWWVETLTRILTHWGIYSRRWIDEATKVPRMHFKLDQPKPTNPMEEKIETTGPLSARIMTRKKDVTE
jgi:hypothetical protein